MEDQHRNAVVSLTIQNIPGCWPVLAGSHGAVLTYLDTFQIFFVFWGFLLTKTLVCVLFQLPKERERARSFSLIISWFKVSIMGALVLKAVMGWGLLCIHSHFCSCSLCWEIPFLNERQYPLQLLMRSPVAVFCSLHSLSFHF